MESQKENTECALGIMEFCILYYFRIGCRRVDKACRAIVGYTVKNTETDEIGRECGWWFGVWKGFAGVCTRDGSGWG